MNNVPKPVTVKKKVLEKHVEAYLVKQMKAIGGESYKWSESRNSRGVPDRICIFPNGEVYLVELKKDRKARLSPTQERFFNRMKELHVRNIDVLFGKEDVDMFIKTAGY